MAIEGALECALAWMDPRSIAAVAMTCRAMAAAAARLTASRAADVARGMEAGQIPVYNSSGYPYFEYSSSCIASRRNAEVCFEWGGDRKNVGTGNPGWDLDELGGDGCSCEHCEDLTETVSFQDVDFSSSSADEHCDTKALIRDDDDGSESKSTTCKRRRLAPSCPCGNYEAVSKLISVAEKGDMDATAASTDKGASSIYECGRPCSCSPSCTYRATQGGVSVKLKVARSSNKGWGLYAAQDIITEGSFVCTYAGELLTTKESRKRQETYDLDRAKHGRVSSLLVLREHLPSGRACLRVNIDATNVGNVARFINHSCDGGNLIPCFVRTAGSYFPRLAFFAGRDIVENEELTFCYGHVDEGESGSSMLQRQLRPCFCGTLACRGILPSEMT